MAKKIIKVSSVTYDLHGTDKIEAIKLAVLGASVNKDRTLSMRLQDNILRGAYSLSNNGYAWAKTSFKDAFPTYSLSFDISSNPQIKQYVFDHIKNNEDSTIIEVTYITYTQSDSNYWINPWLYKYYSTNDWNSYIIQGSDDDDNIYITLKYKGLLPIPPTGTTNKEIPKPDLEDLDDEEQSHLDNADIYVMLNLYSDLHMIDNTELYYYEWTSGTLNKRAGIYIKGNGDTNLDNVNTGFESNDPTFFPIVPLRVDKNWINDGNNNKNRYVHIPKTDDDGNKEDPNDTKKWKRVKIPAYSADLFKNINKYWIKITGTRTQDLHYLESTLEDTNPDIDKINYAFIHQGIDVYTNRKYGAGYLYNFFDTFTNQSLVKSILLKSNLYSDNFYWRVSWSNVNISTIDLSSLPSASQNNLKKKIYATNLILDRINNKSTTDNYLAIYKKINDTQVIVIKVYGLEYSQHVYKNKWDTNTWSDVLKQQHNPDTKTDPSQVIIPLHIDIVKKLSINYRNEICQENTFLVLSSYKVYKKKWYQTGFFKIFIIVIGAILGALIPIPGLSGIGAGLIGSTIGGAIGGIAGVLIGTAINAIIATIIFELFSRVFEKFGILGQIFSFIATLLFTDFINSSSFTQMMTKLNPMDMAKRLINLLSHPNFFQVATLATNVSSAYMKTRIEKVQKTIQKQEETSAERMDRIDNERENILGINNSRYAQYIQQQLNSSEEPNQYLARSLMTPQQYLDMFISTIENYVPNALT